MFFAKCNIPISFLYSSDIFCVVSEFVSEPVLEYYLSIFSATSKADIWSIGKNIVSLRLI